MTLWSSTLQKLFVSIELHSRVLAMIVRGIFKFTALSVDTVECNISYTLGEACSKSTELYDTSCSLCYSGTELRQFVLSFQFTLRMIYSAETSMMGWLYIITM